jgi:GAF domain-containing protein/ANTAR domain-containing protein
MEQLPETRAELDRLSALLGEGMDIGAYLDDVAKVAEALVPSCVGVSITVIIDGDPFTVTATTPTASALDAVQNVEDGPCIRAVETGEPIGVTDVMDEDQWQLFGLAATTHGVRSSWSFPIRDMDGLVSGGMNLYSADADAFTGRARLITAAFGASLREVVSNADLSFATRDRARDLSAALDAREQVDQAVGSLAGLRGWTVSRARSRLDRAALLTGRPLPEIAQVVLAVSSSGG